MKIKSLTLKNFKKFEDKVFEFGDLNTISGMNGEGKSTILEAIVICIYGKLPDGGNDINKFITNGADKSKILVEIEGIGAITRTLSKSGSNRLMLDGEKIAQSVFEQSNNLIPVEYFLSSINPNYWIDLDYKDRRKIFSLLTPKPDTKSLFDEKYPERIWDKFKIMSHKEANRNLKDLKNDIEQYKGRISQIESEIENTKVEKTSFDFDSDKFEVFNTRHILWHKIKEDYYKLERLDDLKDSVDQYGSATESLEKIEEKLESLESRYSIFDLKNTDGTKMPLSQVKAIVKNLPKYENQLNEIKNDIEISKRNYTNQNKAEKDKLCPICGQEISEQALGSMEKDTNFMKLTDDMLALEEKVNKMYVFRDELSDYESNKKLYESQKESYQKIVGNIQFKTAKIEFDRLTKAKDSIMKTYNKINWNEELEQEYLDMKEKKSLADGINERIKQETERLNNSLNDTKKQLELAMGSIEDAELLVEALSPKGVESLIQQQKAKYIEEAVAKFAGGVKVETVEPLKTTDGFKEVFNVSKNGKLEKQLSTGEKVTLAIAFNMAIQKLCEVKFGNNPNLIFMDNASLVSDSIKSKIIKLAGNKQQFYVLNTETELNLASE